MIFRSFYFLSLIIFTVKSENNAFNIMQNILSEYDNTTASDKIISPWLLKQVINFLNCGPLPKLHNGRIQYIIKWEEQKIYLEQKCNRYFRASQRNTTDVVCLNGKWKYQDIKLLTCLQDGEWNFATPVCTLKCFVPEIAGRVVTISEDTILKPRTLINEGRKVIYSCKRSFIPVAFGAVQCLLGKWYPDMQCRKSCTIETQSGLNFILLHNSSVIEYSCSAGETLLGDSKRTCLENGTWNGTLPRCVKSCQLLPEFGIYSYRYSDNLQYLPFGSLIPQNTNITYSCRANYTRNSNGNVTCNNGVLSPRPICSYINTNYISLKKGMLHYKKYSSASICTSKYTCIYFGFLDIGCEKITCNNFNCVTVHFNNATSEIDFRLVHRSCCGLRCY
ncbi:complement factor H-like [Octopus sinensis]|uniref:Complement factor H-like n=1 Tax=Octopus sinensis TaxID=2607531 RepID=A0A7E6EPJ5_9MOLL|nr:complement factor H-like [Octopus sinensis]